MGRKKKPFIDKKHAQTFSLVPRSHKDPLHDDPEEAQYVLKQVQGSKSGSLPLYDEDKRITEQQKYGIYFDDDYDYLQHLKEPGATVLEPVGDSLLSASARKPLLPKDLFGSEVQVEGHDEKVLPISGPQPGWDPDIVAALEAAETSNTVEDELEDDFVTMANGGEVGLPVYITEHLDDDDGAPWWSGREDFSHSGLGGTHRSGVGDQEELSDVSSGRGDGSGQRRTAQFTEYSITSSVVPRSEALTLLDDRFEQMSKNTNTSDSSGRHTAGLSHAGDSRGYASNSTNPFSFQHTSPSRNYAGKLPAKDYPQSKQTSAHSSNNNVFGQLRTWPQFS